MIRKTWLAVSAFAIAGALAALPAPAAAQRSVTCQSTGYDRTYCSADTRGGVRLFRQLSDSPCERNRTWGTDRRGIWVSRGCRAQFTVGDGGYGKGNGRNGGWNNARAAEARRNQAERVCRAAVRDRYSSRGGRVEVGNATRDRSGNYLVRWSTNRETGICRVDERGRLQRVSANRR